MDENKQKALQLAIGQIEKDHGKGALMKLGEGATYPDIEAVSTGSLTLDAALGIGGLPKGRVIEIYGPESSGKTTLALQVIAETQKQGASSHSVVDIHEAKKEMEDKGATVLNEPRIGAHGTPIIFIHPKNSDGVLIELMETPRD